MEVFVRTRSIAHFLASLGILASCAAAHAPTAPDFLRPGTVLVLGELHGTKEIPAVTGQLLSAVVRHRRVLVGVEQPQDAKYVPCSSKGDYPPSWRSVEDGRTSSAMRDFLCKAGRMARAGKIELVYLDQRSATQPVLDEDAAKIFAARFKKGGSIGLILVGNFHARNSDGSLADRLRNMGLNVVTATASTGEQDSTEWQCRDDGCGVKAGGANLCDVSSETPEWIKSPDPRWDYCLVLPKMTASRPAASEAKH